MRMATRSICRSTGISGMPNENKQYDRRGLSADARDLGQPRQRLLGCHRAQELERVVAALLEDAAQHGLDARRLRRPQTARPDDVDELVQRGVCDGRPVRRGLPRFRRLPSQPDKRPGPVLPARRLGLCRPVAAQRVECLLGVDVGAVGREHRQDQLAGGVVDALPDRRAVHRAQRGQRVRHEVRPVAVEPADPAHAPDRPCGASWWSSRHMETRRAARSAARTRGAEPAAMASSTVIGCSMTGTTTAPSRASAAIPSVRDAAAERDARLARLGGPLGHAHRRLAVTRSARRCALPR